MKFLSSLDYHSRLKLNIKLGYVYNFLSLLLFSAVIWYLYESQFLDINLLFILYGVSRLIMVFLEIPTGALADLIGRKNTVALGIFLFGIGWIIIPLFSSVWSIIIGYLISNAGEALISGAQEALTYDTLQELGEEVTFVKIQSGYEVASNTALVIGMIGGGYFYKINQGLPYYLTGLMSILGTIAVLFCIEPNIDTENFSWKNYLKQTKLGIKALSASTAIKQFSYLYMIIGASTFIFVYSLKVSYISSFDISPPIIGVLSAIIQLLGAFLTYLLIKKLVVNERNFWLYMIFIPIIGYIFSAFLKFPYLFIFLLMIQFSSSLRFSGLSLFVNQKVSSSIRATAISTLSMGVSIIFVFLSISSGEIIKFWGINMAMLYLGGFILIATVPVMLSYLKNI